MKNLTILMTLFFSSLTFASTDGLVCQLQSLSSVDELEGNMKQIDCHEIKEQNSCTYTPKDNSDLRKKYSEGLDLIDAYYKKGNFTVQKVGYQALTDVRSQIGEKASMAALGSMTFKDSRSNRRKAQYELLEECELNNGKKDKKPCYDLVTTRGQKVELVSAYHEFLKIGGLDKSLPKFKEAFMDDYFSFQDKFNCPRAEVRSFGSIYPLPRSESAKWGARTSCFKSESEIRQYEPEIKKFFESKNIYDEKSVLEKRVLCSKKIQYKALQVVAVDTPSCGARFEQFFPDNEWDLNEASLAGDESYKEFKNCIEDAKRKGFKLVGINISSSASQLNNTAKAGQKFCPKGFLELSKARANSAKNFLGKEFSLSDKINIHPYGENRNGTSGECPYTLDSKGNEVMKAEYRPGGKKRAELDSAKFVKVNASFEPLRKPATSPTCYEAYVVCESLQYQCSDWSNQKWDKTWDKRRARNQ